MTTDRQKGYASGYAAGRRASANMDREEFRRAVFLACLPSMLDGNWQRGDNPVLRVSDKVQMAWGTADEAMKKARF